MTPSHNAVGSNSSTTSQPASTKSSSVQTTTPSNATPTIDSTANQKANGDTRSAYFVFPIDKFSVESCDEIESALKKYPGELIPYRYGDEVDYWGAELTDSEAKEVRNLAGVLSVDLEGKAIRYRVAPPEPIISPIAKVTDAKPKHKRTDSYTTQLNAPIELVALSQPIEDEASNIDQFKNYVYDKSAGENSFVYHLEDGVAYSAQPQEFTKVETIQTPEARSKLNRPDIDQGDSHATCVAGKAVGKEFGVAKEATLVVVKLDSIRHWEQVAGYKMIRDDLASHPERHGKSVVVVSIAYDPALPNQQPEVTMKQYIQDIMNFDVPVVIAAGNAAEEGRFLVDNVPALFEGPDFPMIVVGSVTPNGEVTSFSQRGDHVSVYAVGQPISCLGMDGPDPIQESGTSFSSPIVAGQIAIILSLEDRPFQTQKGSVVKDLKQYLISGYNSVTRGLGQQRLIWNGVHLIDNPKS
ncbi:peptidase S8/S53 domain-containing protein [Hypoxylon fuscum]|nr:peptidase S8/S53 domain-containing protein [Hypoxylon fuscum]